MATLVLSNIGFEGRHGASAAERRTSRLFQVDVEIDANLDAPARSDRLAETIDFRTVAEIIVGLGTGEAHRLLESLAHDMVMALAAKFPETRVRLELRKLAPPYCAGHPAYAAVRVSHPK